MFDPHSAFYSEISALTFEPHSEFYSNKSALPFDPHSAFYSGESVKQIDVPTLSGAFGILPSHVPTMAALAPGVVSS